MSGVGIPAIHDALASMVAASGRFEQVSKHEAKSGPIGGITAEIYLGPDDMMGVDGSGAVSTSVRVVFTIRVRDNMLSEPQDGIDAQIGQACDDICALLNANYDLNTSGVRAVDLLGIYGDQLKVSWGYINQDGKMYRTGDIYVPVIVNDAWTQVA